MLSPLFFQTCFSIAQARSFSFQGSLRRLEFAFRKRTLGRSLLFASKPQQILRPLQLCVHLFKQAAIFACCSRRNSCFSSSWQISPTRRRFSRCISETQFGLAAALSIFGYAGGFFQKYAQLFRLCLDNAGNHSLLDDGVAASADARAKEDVRYVPAADMNVIDVISGLAIPPQYPFDGNFRIARPLPRRLAKTVVEYQLHARAPDRFAIDRTVENHVLHRFATQCGGPGLSQNPAHRIDNVGLTATVWSYDAYEIAGNRYLGGIDKGFETRRV